MVGTANLGICDGKDPSCLDNAKLILVLLSTISIPNLFGYISYESPFFRQALFQGLKGYPSIPSAG
jgi:hypothetical protein